MRVPVSFSDISLLQDEPFVGGFRLWKEELQSRARTTRSNALPGDKAVAYRKIVDACKEREHSAAVHAWVMLAFQATPYDMESRVPNSRDIETVEIFVLYYWHHSQGTPYEANTFLAKEREKRGFKSYLSFTVVSPADTDVGQVSPDLSPDVGYDAEDEFDHDQLGKTWSSPDIDVSGGDKEFRQQFPTSHSLHSSVFGPAPPEIRRQQIYSHRKKTAPKDLPTRPLSPASRMNAEPNDTNMTISISPLTDDLSSLSSLTESDAAPMQTLSAAPAKKRKWKRKPKGSEPTRQMPARAAANQQRLSALMHAEAVYQRGTDKTGDSDILMTLSEAAASATIVQRPSLVLPSVGQKRVVPSSRSNKAPITNRATSSAAGEGVTTKPVHGIPCIDVAVAPNLGLPASIPTAVTKRQRKKVRKHDQHALVAHSGHLPSTRATKKRRGHNGDAIAHDATGQRTSPSQKGLSVRRTPATSTVGAPACISTAPLHPPSDEAAMLHEPVSISSVSRRSLENQPRVVNNAVGKRKRKAPESMDPDTPPTTTKSATDKQRITAPKPRRRSARLIAATVPDPVPSSRVPGNCVANYADVEKIVRGASLEASVVLVSHAKQPVSRDWQEEDDIDRRPMPPSSDSDSEEEVPFPGLLKRRVDSQSSGASCQHVELREVSTPAVPQRPDLVRVDAGVPINMDPVSVLPGPCSTPPMTSSSRTETVVGEHETLSMIAPIEPNLRQETDAPQKLPLPGYPPIWSQSRQEVCESFDWFRSYQGGVYFVKDMAKGYLLSAFSASRDIFRHNGKLIVSHGGGKAESIHKNHGQTETRKDSDQLADDKSVRALLRTHELGRPLVLIIDDKYALFPYDLGSKGCTYAVLGYYRIAHAWAEKQFSASAQSYIVRYKFAFHWCEEQGKPWWHYPDLSSESIPNHGVVRVTQPNQQHRCNACGNQSPQVYQQGWMCLKPTCEAFWHLRDGTIPQGLLYSDSFIQLQPFPPQHMEDLRPPEPSVNAPDDGITTSSYFTRGWHCKNCGRLSSRFKWEHWECRNCGNICGVTGRIRTAAEFRSQIDGKTFTRHRVEPQSGIIQTMLQMYNCGPSFSNFVTFILPNNRGRIHVIFSAPLANATADDILQRYQHQAACGELRFRRFPLRAHKCRGTLLTNYFSQNTGEPYQYVGGTDNTVPFDNAPTAVLSALDLIKLRMRQALNFDYSFNEVLSAAYMEKQRMAFHSDAEKGLGETVASLSLGASAYMHFRLHAQYAKELADPSKREVLSLYLRHGDVVVMHGSDVQKFYEHTVVPLNFRVAATARFIGGENSHVTR
ncbi:hypothetical protein K474DRAFT_1646966 [Panus rudis PR-1116 ss-1]|nr:hypothetical protein K474DRAFT_1646966 [Panus rudis PR-1116 ss-1]